MSKSSYKTRTWSLENPLQGSPWITSFLLFVLSFCVWYFLVPTLALFYEAAGPSDRGTAVFYSQPTLAGESGLQLYVRDYKESGRDIIPVGYLEMEGKAFENVVWSKDGSVVVAYVAKGDKFLPGDEGSWVGYDFKNHVRIEPPESDQALARGGGPGQVIFPRDKGWREVVHHPWPWQIIR